MRLNRYRSQYVWSDGRLITKQCHWSLADDWFCDRPGYLFQQTFNFKFQIRFKSFNLN